MAKRICPESGPIVEFNDTDPKGAKHWWKRPTDGLCDCCGERPIRLKHARMCYVCAGEALDGNQRLFRASRDLWVRAA